MHWVLCLFFLNVIFYFIHAKHSNFDAVNDKRIFILKNMENLGGGMAAPSKSAVGLIWLNRQLV
jgi:hypothetical protein